MSVVQKVLTQGREVTVELRPLGVGELGRWQVVVVTPVSLGEGAITYLRVVVRDDSSARWAELVSLALHGQAEGWVELAGYGLGRMRDQHMI